MFRNFGTLESEKVQKCALTAMYYNLLKTQSWYKILGWKPNAFGDCESMREYTSVDAPLSNIATYNNLYHDMRVRLPLRQYECSGVSIGTQPSNYVFREVKSRKRDRAAILWNP